MERARWPLRIGVLCYLGALILLPVSTIFYRAIAGGFGNLWRAISDPGALHALWLTAVVAFVAVPLDAVFGVEVALILSRHRFRGVWLLDAIVDVPLAISPVVIGLALILVYGKAGWFGNWLAARGITVIFSLPGIVMASAVVALPYVVRSVLPVLQELGTEQEDAAGTLGAGPWATFRRITLPNIRKGLAYGVTLTTARVIGEFGAVAIVSGQIVGRTQTLTLYISSSLENLNAVGAYVGAVILALCSLGVLAFFSFADRRREAWHGGSAA